MPTLIARTRLSCPAELVAAWYQRPGARIRLHPPFVQEGEGDGKGKDDTLGAGTMRFEPTHDEATGAGCLIEEHIPLASARNQRRLLQCVAYRHRVLVADVLAHAHFPGRKLRVVIAGSSGLLGRALAAHLSAGGHEIVRLVRPGSRSPTNAIGTASPWDPATGTIDRDVLANVDAVVNLGGEGIADGRWTQERKRRIRDSRVLPTGLLARTLADVGQKSTVLLNASAIGYYGSRGDERLTEESPAGQGWLPELGREWEEATAPATAAGMRVVLPRFGVVLTPTGGPLLKMLPFFRAGIGGKLGPGAQWFSWIALDDLLAAVHRMLLDDAFSGPVNTAAPEPVRNADFTRALGKALSRPAFLPVPSLALKVLFGELAQTMLEATRVLPVRLQAAGFHFRFPKIEAAFAHMFGRMDLPAPREDSAGNLVVDLDHLFEDTGHPPVVHDVV